MILLLQSGVRDTRHERCTRHSQLPSLPLPAACPHLYVGGEVVCDEAGRPQVYDLDLAARVALDQDVFGLEVGVDQAQGVEEGERGEHLGVGAGGWGCGWVGGCGCG